MRGESVTGRLILFDSNQGYLEIAVENPQDDDDAVIWGGKYDPNLFSNDVMKSLLGCQVLCIAIDGVVERID